MIVIDEKRHAKMFWSLCVSIIICVVVANAQPLSCQEDAHCSEGYFCEKQANMCQECLRCNDHKREPPKKNLTNACIKSITSCGPCTDGFINIYGEGMKGKCVLPIFFENGSGSHYILMWITAAFISMVIVAGFVYVIRHTEVFKIVAYYNPVPGTTPLAGAVMPATTPSLRHLPKFYLHFEKNPVNK